MGNVEHGEYRSVIEDRVELNVGFLWAYGSATVRAYGSATILLSRWSIQVRLEIKSVDACAVDRRQSPPTLITAPTPEN